MSTGERKLADVQGKFTQVVRDGTELNDASWSTGRVLLSTERLVIASSGGKRTVPLSRVDAIGERHDVNQAVAAVGGYVSFRFGENVVLVSPSTDGFETDVYRALLDRTVVLVRHPAVEGGVVQDTDWEKARLQVDDEALNVATASGGFVPIDLDDIGGLNVAERTVGDDRTEVVETEHSDDGTSVQTYFSGDERQTRFLAAFLREGERRSEAGVDLSEAEDEVLMALYSGVSPFDIPDFVGMEVEEVEEIFERLVDLDVLDEVRVRREVALNARGRNIASKAMNDQ